MVWRPFAARPRDVAAATQAGNVVGSFPTGLAAGAGLAYDTAAHRLWISNPDAPDLRLLGRRARVRSTCPTGRRPETRSTFIRPAASGRPPAPTTRAPACSGRSTSAATCCLFEVDPVAKVVTGRKICGPWSASQRAVAYDYVTDTYYVGGTNEATVYHVDGSGNLLDSAVHRRVDRGPGIQPGHRAPVRGGRLSRALQRLDRGPEERLRHPERVRGDERRSARAAQRRRQPRRRLRRPPLDARRPPRRSSTSSNRARPAGARRHSRGFRRTRRRGRSAGGGGTLPVDGDVRLRRPASGPAPGLSHLRDGHAGPGAARCRSTSRCSSATCRKTASRGTSSMARLARASCRAARRRPPTFSFCPADVVTRRSMAGFIERAVHGALTPPPVYLGEFDDVLLGSFNANYIQGLVNDEITAGCGGRRTTVRTCPSRARRWRSSSGRDSTARRRRRRARLRAPSATCRARAGSRWTTSRAFTPRGSRPAAATATTVRTRASRTRRWRCSW